VAVDQLWKAFLIVAGSPRESGELDRNNREVAGRLGLCGEH